MDSALSIVVEQIRAATAGGRPLRIRGGGSKDFYGQTLQGDILDTRALNGIVSYEPSELVVTVRAGTPLAELEALLASRDQQLAFEPPHFGDGATVGGMVAAGLAGPARQAAGAVRDYVLGIQMVNGHADVLNFGGQVMKNVAGYDLSRLQTGALGTLGLITEVSLKVLPMATAQATLLFELDQATALRRLNAWAGQPLPLNASYWAQEQGRGRLCVRLRGALAAVQAACQGMGGERANDSVAIAGWSGLREQTLPFFRLASDQCLWRLSLPDSSGVLTPDADADSALVEWGGALRWIKAPADAAVRLRAAAEAVGGSATLFRFAAGDTARQQAVFHRLSAPLQRIHSALKKQFDPAAIFNRARIYPDL